MQDPWLIQFEERRKERNQRSESERTLIVEGEHLTVKPAVAPEVAFDFVDFNTRLGEQVSAIRAAEETGKPIPELLLTDHDMLDAAEQTVRSCLEPDSLPAWQRLRAVDHPAPLTTGDIYAIADKLLAKTSGLPTAAPGGSSNGRTRTANSSKAASSLPAKTRKR